MTPQQKALELIGRFYKSGIKECDCKKCALIAVDEIIKELTEEISPSVHGFRHKYWQKVKQEIEKL